MDFLTVYITSKLTHAKTSALRIAAASSAGAVYGVISVIYIDSGAWAGGRIVSVIGSAAVSLLMSYIAFGFCGGIIGALKQSAVIWGSGALLGGIMSVIMSMGEPVFLDDAGASAYSKYFVITFALSVLIVRIFSARKSEKNAEVEIMANGEIISLTALVDSGNLLREPLSGNPVIIISHKLLSEKTKAAVDQIKKSGMTAHGVSAETESMLKLRIIPHKTINGAGIMYGFVPDEVMVCGVRKNAVIAVDDSTPDYGGFLGIVPQSLC